MTPLETAYKKFKDETINPEIDFSKEDIVKVMISLRGISKYFCRAGILDLINKSLDAKIDENSYLIRFLSSIEDIIEVSDKSRIAYVSGDVEMTIDLNKLKYCKTLLCYWDSDIAEIFLEVIDHIQDQIANLGIAEDRIFYFPKEENDEN